MIENSYTVKRWIIALAGVFLQLILGSVYAWSYFQKPIMSTYGWNNSQVAWIFSLAIMFLGLSAAVGGVWLPKYGPRKLAMTGGILYGAGHLLSAYALTVHSLPLLYAGYGVVHGCGLGLGYVTPVATASKWFPDRKGLVTGMVVMGFGFGALLMSKVIAPAVLQYTGGNLVPFFMNYGLTAMALILFFGFILENPPAGFTPPGYAAEGTASSPDAKSGEAGGSAIRCLMSSKFILMWIIFFFNITAGIMFISFQSPMLQDLLKLRNPSMDAASLAAAGGTLIGISSLFNGLGRMFWGGISDRIGRIQAFRIILGTQVAVFLILVFVKNPFIFGVLVCYVLLCYGGGFGSMPSYVSDVFGAGLMPVVYGTILTAWGTAGIAGPQIVAFLKDNMQSGASAYTFITGAVLLASGFVAAFFLDNGKFYDI